MIDTIYHYDNIIRQICDLLVFNGYLILIVDCPHPTCSGHGFCIEGSCFCKKGWKGMDCSDTDKEALQCLPDCSGHGVFDLETQTCTCEARWSGDDCSKGKSLFFPMKNHNNIFIFKNCAILTADRTVAAYPMLVSAMLAGPESTAI